MNIYFKLKAFPQVSETFIVNNLVYAKQKGFDIKIYVNRYLGLKNSSQVSLLKENEIEQDILKPFQFSANKYVKLLQLVEVLANVKVLKFYKYYFLKRGIKWARLSYFYQYRFLSKNELVHVHFNNKVEPLVYLHSINYLNQKVIVTFHGYDAFLENKETFKDKYGEFYKKHVVAVTVNSNYLQDQVVKLGIEMSKIHVVPIGIDTIFFKNKPKQLNSNEIKILSVGRLIQWKGHVYGLKATKRLIDKGYNIFYTVIGAGKLEKELKAEALKLNIIHFVNFTGAQPQREVRNEMTLNDIFLLPSTFDDIMKRRETFGLASVEAQAMGLPVVGFRSGGFPDTIIEGETGFAVEDRNVEQLAAKIEYLISHPNIYSDMSKAAIKHAQKFDHCKTTQQYLDLYQKFNA